MGKANRNVNFMFFHTLSWRNESLRHTHWIQNICWKESDIKKFHCKPVLGGLQKNCMSLNILFSLIVNADTCKGLQVPPPAAFLSVLHPTAI